MVTITTVSISSLYSHNTLKINFVVHLWYIQLNTTPSIASYNLTSAITVNTFIIVIVPNIIYQIDISNDNSYFFLLFYLLTRFICILRHSTASLSSQIFNLSTVHCTDILLYFWSFLVLIYLPSATLSPDKSYTSTQSSNNFVSLVLTISPLCKYLISLYPFLYITHHLFVLRNKFTFIYPLV